MTQAAGGVRSPVVDARDISKIFPMPAGPVTAVQHVTLRIDPGEYIAICGPSGCGKSTLLHILGCVETPTAGALYFDETRWRRFPMRSAATCASGRLDSSFSGSFFCPC